MFTHSMRQPNFALLVGLAWLAIVAQLLAQHWTVTTQMLGDSDDAMRLVEVRAFLAGRGWFDLHEPRVQPPFGYDTHWSRLIDAGLAGLYLIFRLGAENARAEHLMRVVWPLLWLVPAMAGTTAIAWRLAGRQAALVTILLLLAGLPAFQQFRPGRIDHHNVQIALTMLTLAAAVWADRARWLACAAGALSGLALAVGFESLPFIAIAGGAFAARYILDREAAPAVAAYGWSAAAGTLLAFLISVRPVYWTQGACDAIAINSVAAAVLGGTTLAIAGQRCASERTGVRCTAIMVAAGLAAAAFVLLEPRCIGGPFAMVEPAIWPIWHSHVRELQPFLAVAREYPASAAAIAAYPIAGLCAIITLVRHTGEHRNISLITAAGAFLAAVAMTLVAVRASSYTIWLGMPLVAAAALRLFACLKLETLAARVLATILLAPAVLAAGAITLAEAAGQRVIADRQNAACFRSENYAQLALLPAGLVAADIDHGPFLLALTPHSVVAAPYHRLSTGIVASHRAMAAPPAEAQKILGGWRAAYVAICGARPPEGLTDVERRDSLWGVLRAGTVPNWLEPMPDAGPLAVYRIK